MKNINLIISFLWFCITHPRYRFWQALAAWSGRFIYQSNRTYEYVKLNNTFFLEDKKIRLRGGVK